MSANWWTLFFEPCRSETPPPETAVRIAAQRRWVDHHCLRAAETGLFLPYLHIYGNGPGVSVYWSEDDPQTCPNAPGHFLYSGFAQLDTRQAMTAVGEFVSKVLAWCDGVSDARIDRLRADWNAITGADGQEQEFCRAAGRLGLDPYAIGDWTAGLAEFLSTRLGPRAEDAIVEDLLESVDPMSASLSWEWASTVERSFGLSAGTMPQIDAGSEFRTAKDQGYFVARQLRNIAGLAPDQPVDEIGALSRAAGGPPFSFEQHDHLPTRALLAAVGCAPGTRWSWLDLGRHIRTRRDSLKPAASSRR